MKNIKTLFALIVSVLFLQPLVAGSMLEKPIDACQMGTPFYQSFTSNEDGNVTLTIEGTYDASAQTVDVNYLFLYKNGAVVAHSSSSVYAEFPGGNLLLGATVCEFQNCYSFGIAAS
ncbi:hypothetical protein [Algoriphagus resistens]|uniref:hypothetical protein n=1 Tax=Algoriphagus resistens TaxID=1750590 RepID=UPI000716895E|nr:hypothetical protein [Algoriphagus resistens]